MKYKIKEILYYILYRLPRSIIGRYLTHNLIYVHWGRGLKNFGDCLQPDTLKYYGLLPVYVPSLDKSDVILAGSILQLVSDDYNGYIIGTGGDNYKYHFQQAKILAVRGVLTKNNIRGGEASILLGDTGLLAPKIYPKEVKKKYDLGIVLHFVDQNSIIEKNYRQKFYKESVLFINVLRSPKDVINDIKSCNAIVSSSLHGLIIADSFHIPNKWIINRETMPTSFYEYKFNDYYSSLELMDSPYIVNGFESYDELKRIITLKPVKKIDCLIEDLDRLMTQFAKKFIR